MEEKLLKNYGLETLNSSELLMIRGGISLGGLKRLVELFFTIAEAVDEYWEDFARGWDKGWDMI